MLPADRVTHLEQSLADAQKMTSPYYDEAFLEVQQRISDAGSVGKSDIAVLTFWKRLRADARWVPALLERPDHEVREITGPAVLAARSGDVAQAAGRAREMLRPLPGFKQGTALGCGGPLDESDLLQEPAGPSVHSPTVPGHYEARVENSQFITRPSQRYVELATV